MGGFFAALFTEMGARRKRLRTALGDRVQGLVEFLVLGGLAMGSLGLFLGAWMPAAAPWGFALPVVFVIGFLLIDARRQATLARADSAERVSQSYDWIVLGWSFACALAGAAAFVIAFSAKPHVEEEWTPPQSAVSVDISP